MRALVQRVTEAWVTIDGDEIARIGPGLLVLIGVGRDDTEADATTLAGKTAALRVFEGADGGPERSVTDVDGEVLVVSQFTLMGDTRKGNRPSWSHAAPPAVAEPLVASYVARLRAVGGRVAAGRFGAHMQIGLTNDGPVTLILDTRSDANTASQR